MYITINRESKKKEGKRKHKEKKQNTCLDKLRQKSELKIVLLSHDTK